MRVSGVEYEAVKEKREKKEQRERERERERTGAEDQGNGRRGKRERKRKGRRRRMEPLLPPRLLRLARRTRWIWMGRRPIKEKVKGGKI